MTIKTPKKFKGIPHKPKKYLITEEIIKRKITIKKGEVEMNMIISDNEMEILGIGPAPKYFKFKNRKTKKTIQRWKNVLECMQKLVDIAKVNINREINQSNDE